MTVLLLNIPFYEKYSGIEDNSLNTYDKFFKEKKGNNPEIYNFQDYNGYCYGYISAKDGIVDLSKIKFTNDESLLFENCLVIWVCKNTCENNYKLIGWYKNANVFKYLQKKISYPSVGRDLYFNIKSKSKDAFLLNLTDRNYNIDISFENNSNIVVKNINDKDISEIVSFINSYSKPKFNITYTNNLLNKTLEFAPNNPITLSKRASIFMYNENNFLEAIKFFNTALLHKENLNPQEILNIKYEKALCLQMLNCFNFAINEFVEILSLSEYNFNICKNLMYLYFIVEDYENATIMCDKIIENEINSEENENILNEINCLKAESLIYQDKINEAKILLHNIINATKLLKLKEHCINIINNIDKII